MLEATPAAGLFRNRRNGIIVKLYPTGQITGKPMAVNP